MKIRNRLFDGGAISTVLGALFVYLFGGGEECRKFDREKYAHIARNYIEYSRSSSRDGLFLGKWQKSILDLPNIRPANANEQSDGVVAVVPIDVGAGIVDLNIWPDCTFYVMPPR